MIRQQFRRGALPAFVAFVLSFVWTPAATAQDQPPARERKNSVYGELFGSGWGLTLNYERAFTSRISARLGGGLAEDGQPVVEFSMGAPPAPEDLALLASSNVVLLGRRHQLFAGAGVRVLWIRYGYKPTEAEAMLTAELGYRFCSKSGFLFKATLAGTSKDWSKNYPQWVMPGLTVGWAF